MAWTSTTAPFRHLEGGTPIVLSEEAENDSDKTLVVSSDVGQTVLLVTGIRIEYGASADVGTREMTMELLDSADDIVFSLNLNAATNVTAGSTVVTELLPGSDEVAAIDGGAVRGYLPPHFWIGAGNKLRIYDRNAVAATADDMVIHVRAMKHTY